MCIVTVVFFVPCTNILTYLLNVLLYRELTHSVSGDIAGVRPQNSRNTRSVMTHDGNVLAFT